jgi:hypothetical protein
MDACMNTNILHRIPTPGEDTCSCRKGGVVAHRPYVQHCHHHRNLCQEVLFSLQK